MLSRSNLLESVLNAFQVGKKGMGDAPAPWAAMGLEPLESRVLFSGESIFPADSGVVDVAAFGAIPDDGVDDTAAIQAALDSTASTDTIFYFADGVYNVSDTLQPPDAPGGGVPQETILQGQSQDGAIIKLDDNLAFTDALISFGGAPNADAFRNSVRDLTIDIGSGNPDAQGLNFNANNSGTVKNVTIRSLDANGDPASQHGETGLVITAFGPGPLLVEDVTIQGFETGILTGQPTASLTFEDVTLIEQGTVGWKNQQTQSVYARGLQSVNDVKVIDNVGESRFLLVDSELVGLSGAAAQTAITTGEGMFVRNVSTPGYGTAIAGLQQNFRGSREVVGPYVEEYWSEGVGNNRRGGTFQLFDSPETTLGLDVRKAPDPAFAPLSEWASPVDFGAVANDGVDDTDAIQAAVDSGAGTVYLPNGEWHIEGTVTLRGDVERFLGTEATIRSKSGNGVIRLGNGSAGAVTLERLQTNLTIEHDSDRTLSLRNLTLDVYRNTTNGTGDLFVTDVSGAPFFITNQRAWMRQVNPEGGADFTDPDKPAKIINDGGRLWVLGLKTEDVGTWVRTINGGTTEVLGAYKVGGGTTTGIDNAAFVTIDSDISVALAEIAPGAGGFEHFYAETRGGVTRSAVPAGSPDVYVGSAFDDDEVVIDSEDSSGVATFGNWTQASLFFGGYLGETILTEDTSLPRATDQRVVFTPTLASGGYYEVFGRWTRDTSGGLDHASNAPYEIDHAGGTTTVNVDQNTDGGAWRSLGTYEFNAGASGGVTINTTGVSAGETVLADSVRFRRAFPLNDIGSGGGAGDVTITGGDAFDIDGVTGGAIGGTSDAFTFVSESATADLDLTAELASGDATGVYGLMVRDGLADDAPHVFVGTTGANSSQLEVRVRATAGGSTTASTYAAGGDDRFRITRRGDEFTVLSSADGLAWTQLSSVTIEMGRRVEAGLAVTDASVSFEGVDLDRDRSADDFAPVAVDDAYQAIAGQAIDVSAEDGVLANDSDRDEFIGLAATIVSGPSQGSLTLNDDGSFTYTPNTAFDGVDGFVYEVTDASGLKSRATAGISVTDLDAGSVAHWLFDETSGTSAADASGNGNTGTLANGAAFTAGYDGNAVSFDGVDDVVDVGTFDVGSGAITLAARFKADAFTDDVRLISKADGTAAHDHLWMIGLNQDKIRVRLTVNPTGGGSPVTYDVLTDAQAGLSTELWHLVAATWDGSTLRVYLDGDEVYSQAAAGQSVATDSSMHAAVGNQPVTEDRPFAGLIDEARVYDRALPVDELDKLTPANIDAVDDRYAVIEGNGLEVDATVGVLANDEDFAGADATVEIVDRPDHGLLVLGRHGNFTFRPDAGFVGSDAFTYRASDGVNTAIGEVTLDVVTELVGHWKLDETSGTSAADASGNGNTGTLLNGAAFTSEGLIGSGLDIDDGDDAVDLGTLDGTDALGFTASSLVRLDSFTGGASGGRILSKANGTAADDHLWMLSITENDTIRFRLTVDDGQGGTNFLDAETAALSLQAGRWHQVAASWDGATANILLDGAVVHSAALEGVAVAIDDNVSAHIGNNPDSLTRGIDGVIDDVRLYRRALTVSELRELAPHIDAEVIDLSTASVGFGGDKLLDGSGLDASDRTHDTDSNNHWITTAGDTTPEITFDLGATYDLTAARVWNYNDAATTRGARQIDVYLAGDADGNDAPDAFTLFRSFELDEGSNLGDEAGEALNLSDGSARFVRFDIVENHGNPDFAGLAEVEFFGIQTADPAGDTIAGATVLDFSSRFNASFGPDNTLDRSGITEPSNDHDDDAANMWVTASGDTTPEVTYDLGDVFELTSLRLWNYNEVTDRGAATVDVYVASTLDINGDPVFDATADLTLNPVEASGTDVEDGELFDFTGLTGRYVKLDVTANHGNATFAGLSEVEFRGRAFDPGTEVSGVSVESSSSRFGPSYSADNLVDGSGLGAGGTHSTDALDTWVTASGDPTPQVTFDLGATYTLHTLQLWNYNESSRNRGAASITLYTSTDGVSFTMLTTINPLRAAGAFDTGEYFDLTGVEARYVRLDVTSNYGDPNFGGLSEVRFHGDAV